MPHNHNGQKWIRNEKRCAIYARDGFRCVYCGERKRLCLDHLDPEGGNAEDNLVSSCWDCNTDKGVDTLEAWLKRRVARGEDPEEIASLRQYVAIQTFLPIDLRLGKILDAHRDKGGFEILSTWRRLRRTRAISGGLMPKVSVG